MTMIKSIGFAFLLFYSINGFGQSANAEVILSSMIEKMKGAAGYEGDFTFIMYFGNEIEHSESGKIYASGKRLRLDLASYQLISNGISNWMYLKDRNEVQLTDYAKDDYSMYNPLGLLDHFFEGGFEYEITDQLTTDDRELAKLDFKPNDHESDIAKISVLIDVVDSLPKSFIIVQTDGYRYEILVHDLKLIAMVDEQKFIFNESAYPDVLIEDLRLGE